MLVVGSGLFFLLGLVFSLMSLMVFGSVWQTMRRGSSFEFTLRDRLKSSAFLGMMAMVSASFLGASILLWSHPLLGIVLGLWPIVLIAVQLATTPEQRWSEVERSWRRIRQG